MLLLNILSILTAQSFVVLTFELLLVNDFDEIGDFTFVHQIILAYLLQHLSDFIILFKTSFTKIILPTETIIQQNCLLLLFLMSPHLEIGVLLSEAKYLLLE